MKASVCIVTYNHEPFIAQAIDGVLMQEVDFDYELIIGEDDSSDNTRNIVKEYKRRYPEIIRLILNDRQNVVYIDGKPTGRWNLISSLKHATGEYIALCEGDDYWTSIHKLQKQVDFLESHPDCAICFHPVQVLYEGADRPPDIIPKEYLKEFSTLEDLLRRSFVPTCSMAFRNGLVKDFPEWYYSAPVGDWTLAVLLAEHGTIGQLPDVMATYRVHSGGRFTSRDPVQYDKNRLKTFEAVNAHSRYRYENILNNRMYRVHHNLVNAYWERESPSEARAHARECFRLRKFRGQVSNLGFMKMLFRAYTPTFYRLLKNARDHIGEYRLPHVQLLGH